MPTHRLDVSQEVDLIEEIARHMGYDKIPTWEPVGNVYLEQHIETRQDFAADIRSTLVGAGFTEVVNYSFYSPGDLKKINWEGKVTRIKNPIGEEYSVMRPSLIPSLLKNLALNLSHQNKRVRIFELRNVYDSNGGQRKQLVILMSGSRHPLHWALDESEVSFYDMKGAVELLLDAVRLKKVLYSAHEDSLFQPGISAEISSKVVIGRLGKCHPSVLGAYGIKQAAFLCELDIETLQEAARQKTSFQSLTKYPSIQRDLSILVPLEKHISYQALVSELKKRGSNLLKQVALFDRYRGKSIPDGFESLAFSLTYHSSDRTLKDEEVNRVHEGVCKHLIQKWAIKIR